MPLQIGRTSNIGLEYPFKSFTSSSFFGDCFKKKKKVLKIHHNLVEIFSVNSKFHLLHFISILQKIENIKIVTFKCHKNVHYIEVTRGAESSLIPPNYPDGQFLADIVHTKCQLLPMCPDSVMHRHSLYSPNVQPSTFLSAG